MTKSVNMTNCKLEIRVLAFDTQLICSEYGFKHNMRQIKNFVCLRLAYCLPVLNMDRKRDSQIDELVMQLIGNKNSLRT